jgi:ABC-type multidrug transport system fused ATPase/permease subunit
MRALLKFFDGSSGRLFAGLGLSVGQTLLLLPIPLLLGLAFDRAIPNRSVGELVAIGLAVIILHSLSAAVSIRARGLTVDVVKRAVFGLRQALMATRYAQPRRFYAAVEPATVHDLLIHDTERLDIIANAVLSHLVPALVLMTGVSAILLWLSWPLTLATLAMLPPAALLSHYTRLRLRVSTRAFHASFERFNRATLLALEATDLTRIEAAEDSEIARQSQAMDDVRRTSAEMARRQYGSVTVHSALATMIGGAILVVGGILLSRGALALGELMSFYAALALLRTTAGNALSTMPLVIEGRDVVQRIGRALGEGAAPEYAGQRALTLRGQVLLEAVSFGYEEQAPLFCGLDLRLEPGTAVGISGESGAGKTTLVMLILGLYKPRAGRLYFDGEPLDALDLRGLRRQIGVLPQDPLILPGTVTENIAFGLDRAAIDAERVREAAILADADSFVRALPAGYDTVLGTRGLRLSGGQRQRLALARALVRQPRVLILDEPTNHLGSATVKNMLDVVARWPHPPAILAISHDPVLLAHLPRVLKLEHGRLSDCQRRRSA